jgi:outer membrane protein assembly factor BamE (lipoprotein component of BamABCDE complex)
MIRKSASTLAAVALAFTAMACTPTQDRHGFIAEGGAETPKIEAGVDTKTTVEARLGTPSTKGVFDSEVWYYISTTQARLAYFKPKTVDREIVAVRFGENDVVEKVDVFGVDKGQVIAYNDDKTATRGRELGFLEQLFGTIGRNPTGLGTNDAEDARNRRR